MNNKGTLLTAIILALAIALSGYFIGNMHKKGKAYDRSVEVKGLAEREVKADLAVWPFQISNAGNDLAEMQREIANHKEEVEQFLSDLGFGPEELNVGSTQIEDAMANVYGNNARSAFRYIAKSDFTIRTNQTEKLKEAVSASLALAAKGILLNAKNTWQPIEYIFTGLNNIKPAMIAEATENARQVAEKFAQDSNSAVGKIKSARQGIFSISNRDQNTPEIKNVRVVTTIHYLLKD